LAGLRRRYIAGSLFIFLLTIPLMWIFMLRDYQKQRILTLLSPEDDLLGSGWNIVQSKTAIGSGGLYGKGWLNGTQSQLDFLPESHTDFIIAVLAEEFGLIGVICTLAAYAFLLSRCFFISAHAKSQFGRLFAGSFAVMIFAHIFVNLGMVSGILPIVGAPLPLISFGGNSALTLFMGFGILTSISHEPRRIRS
jgi:rod shape determining protein RodA